MPPSTPPGQECIVYPMIDASGWAVNYPPTMTFTRTYTQESFTAEVQVPPETSAWMEGAFQFSARWQYSPGMERGTIQPSTAMIYVNPFCYPEISCEKSVLRTSVGEWVEFQITLTNLGNIDSNITIQISGDSDLEFEQDSISITVPEMRSIEVSIRVRQKNGAGKTNSINLMAVGPYNGENTEDNFPLYLKTVYSMGSLMKSPVFIVVLSTILLTAIGISVIIYRKRRSDSVGNRDT